MQALYGLPTDAVLSESDWQTRIYAEDLDLVVETMARSAAGAGETEMEFRIVLPDGAIRYLRSLSMTVCGNTGAPIRIVGISQDITKRRSIEQELTRLTERMTLALSAGSLGVWELNIVTGDNLADDTLLAQFGLDPYVTAPLPVEQWMNNNIHPDDRWILNDAIAKTLTRDQPTEAEYRVIWPDGSTHILNTLAVAVREGKKPPERLVGITQDVSKSRAMAKELEEEKLRLIETVELWTAAKHAAEAANKAKSEFLTIMSHELRTPLNAILGFGEMLTLDHFGPLTAKQSEYVGAIRYSGAHLLALIDEILELSTIEAGKMEVTIGPVILAPVVKSAVSTLMPDATRRSITLRPGDYGANAPVILADPRRLAQALINLGSNAIKYNHEGGEVDIVISVPETGWVRLTVTDTGIGIPENRQREIFMPFTRLSAPELAIEGTGVGLALTHRLVDLMGGRIGFTSELGRGSSFWLEFPIAAPANALDGTGLGVSSS